MNCEAARVKAGDFYNDCYHCAAYGRDGCRTRRVQQMIHGEVQAEHRATAGGEYLLFEYQGDRGVLAFDYPGGEVEE